MADTTPPETTPSDQPAYIDYSYHFECLCISLRDIRDSIAHIRDSIAMIRDDVETMKNYSGDMRDDFRITRIRLESENLGIYMNHVCKICDDERALLMSSLVRTGDLDAVIAEKNNPTPPNDFFPPN